MPINSIMRKSYWWAGAALRAKAKKGPHGFRVQSNPVQQARDFSEAFAREGQVALQEAFGFSEEDSRRVLAQLIPLQTLTVTYSELLEALADGSKHTGTLVDSIRERSERLPRLYAQILSDPITARVLGHMPEIWARNQTRMDAACQVLEAHAGRIMPAVSIMRKTTRPGSWGVADGVALAPLFSALFEPGLKSHLQDHGNASPSSLKSLRLQDAALFIIFGIYECLDVCRDRSFLPDLERFTRRLSFHLDSFRQRARQERSDLAWEQLRCFKWMVYALAAKDAERAISIARPSISTFNQLAMVITACPYLLLQDDATLDELAAIARSVPSLRMGQALRENPQWIDSRNTFAELKKLLARLEQSPSSYAFSQIVSGQSLATALALLEKLTEKPTLLSFYETHLQTAKKPPSAPEFAEYILEVAAQPVGEKTFHEILEEVLPHLPHDIPARIVRSAALLYVSGIWKELAGFLTTESEKPVALAALSAIEKGQFERAQEIIARRITALEEEADIALTLRLQRAYPHATSLQQDLFKRIYQRLEEMGMEEKRFAALRKHGLETMEAVARETETLLPAVFRTVFVSDGVRILFVKAAGFPGFAGFSERLNAIAKTTGPEELEAALLAELESYREETDAIGSRVWGRIVLIAGEQVADTLSGRLRIRTSLEVKAVGDQVGIRDLSFLTSDDIVVVATSHLAHSASGAAVSMCRKRGATLIRGSQTNAEFIARRVQQAVAAVQS